MSKMLKDFADAGLYLMLRAVQLGLLVLGISIFLAGLFGAI